MKNMIGKKTVMMLTLALVNFGAFSQHDHGNHGDKKEMSQQIDPKFEDKDFGNPYSHYILLKESLVRSQSQEAKEAVNNLQQSLAIVENATSAQAEASKVASASNLDEQRKAFASLSNEMTKLVKAKSLVMGEIYLKHCPMANGNGGAYWLSSQKEIRNPYFGDKMMKCGSVNETIN